jgi:hypothetical protein
MPWRAAAIVARLSWCRNDGEQRFRAAWKPIKQQVINKNRANHLREISSAAVFSVSSNRLFKRF